MNTLPDDAINILNSITIDQADTRQDLNCYLAIRFSITFCIDKRVKASSSYVPGLYSDNISRAFILLVCYFAIWATDKQCCWLKWYLSVFSAHASFPWSICKYFHICYPISFWTITISLELVFFYFESKWLIAVMRIFCPWGTGFDSCQGHTSMGWVALTLG